MSDRDLPKYAVFDDFRYSQRIAVVVRWFLLVTWFFLHNYRAEPSEPSYFINNGLAAVLSVFNGYVHWRIWRGRPVSKRYVVALSAMDLSLITIGIAVSSRFGNTFFVLYYPALLGLSVVFPSRRVAFTAVVTVAVAYAGVSFLITPPGVAIAPRQVTEVVEKEEKVLLIRLAAMFAVVAAGNLITRVERDRRREAVEAERARAEENLELQKRAREAELAVQQERDRIARDIHDGIAQSIYALSLNLETCAELAERGEGALKEQAPKASALRQEGPVGV